MALNFGRDSKVTVVCQLFNQIVSKNTFSKEIFTLLINFKTMRENKLAWKVWSSRYSGALVSRGVEGKSQFCLTGTIRTLVEGGFFCYMFKLSDTIFKLSKLRRFSIFSLIGLLSVSIFSRMSFERSRLR